MEWFAGEEHQPFLFEPEAPMDGPRTGVMLLHGFMGTPKEMRPLGKALAGAGFVASGPLLPGFGPQMGDLNTTVVDDWTRVANASWNALTASCERTMLVGFSMGAAVALHIATVRPPDRLVIMAPLWRLADSPILPLISLLPVLKYVVREFKPFARANFADAGIRHFFDGMNADLDLDDTETQERIREETSVSMAVIDELRQLTVRAKDAAPKVRVPALVIQGARDDIVPPARTRKLVARMGGRVTLMEVDSQHLLVADDGAAWSVVRDSVLAMACEARDMPVGTAGHDRRSRGIPID